jgi:hypothetical protein
MHSSQSPIRAEFPQQRDLIEEAAAQRPMSQQDAFDCHGHEMHPQKFVRLVGCHDVARAEETHGLH